MNARMVRTTLAIASVLIASIVIGGMIIFVGGVTYRWLAEVASPGLALTSLVSGSLVLGALIVFMGQLALRQALQWSHGPHPRTPDQMIVGELLKVVDGSPTKLVLASLGVGFALGLSPRLRRVIYRTFVD